jgi:hypothetical protein
VKAALVRTGVILVGSQSVSEGLYSVPRAEITASRGLMTSGEESFGNCKRSRRTDRRPGNEAARDGLTASKMQRRSLQSPTDR